MTNDQADGVGEILTRGQQQAIVTRVGSSSSALTKRLVVDPEDVVVVIGCLDEGVQPHQQLCSQARIHR